MAKETLTITDYSDKGTGLATFVRPDGKTCDVEVPFTLVGEKVEAEIFKNSKKKPCAYRAKDLVILKESSSRITPRCPHFGLCGGCSLQHMTYEEQLRWKEEKIFTLFAPYRETVQFHPIMAADSPWGYRNKMEFSFGQDAAGKKFLGLIIGNSRGRVFDLNECYLIDQWAVDCLLAVRSWWHASSLAAYSPRNNEGALRNLTIRTGKTSNDKMVILTVSGRPEYAIVKAQVESFVEAVKALPAETLSIVLRIHQAIKGQPTQIFEMILSGPDHVRETIHDLKFHISPNAFFQPNTLQASKLYERTLSLANLNSSMTLCDLYCGVGVFGMLAAQKVKTVYGIELDHDAAYDARVNAERLGISNFTVRRGDVATVLKEMALEGLQLRPEVVLVDPPRAGLGPKAVEEIEALRPSTLMYVSCNPKTQAEDVLLLSEKGFRVTDIQPVDQFPQTPHVENILRLVR